MFFFSLCDQFRPMMSEDQIQQLVSEKSPETRNKLRRLHYEQTKDFKLRQNPVVVMKKLNLGKIKVVKCS